MDLLLYPAVQSGSAWCLLGGGLGEVFFVTRPQVCCNLRLNYSVEGGVVLVSHKYKFIFIKTSKTAGTSIEVDLSKEMASEDVVTPVFPVEIGHEPRNYFLNGVELFNHVPARVVRDVFGVDVFREYYKFCVEREPVDKCISHYCMLKNSPFHCRGFEGLSWQDYLDNKNFPVDHNKYTDEDGALLVDRVIHYERLEVELREVMKCIGVPFGGLRSRAKSGFRGGNHVVLDASLQDAELIYDAFLPSSKYTGYCFDDFARNFLR